MTQSSNFHTEISGTVDGNVNVVQAGVIKAGTVTMSVPAKQILNQLEQAQQHLLLSRRAEQRTGLLVSLLQVALFRAFQLIGQLTAERDGRLPEAQEKHRRTENQLDRAEADHLRATALCHTLGRRIRTLQEQLLAEEPAAAAQLNATNNLPPSPGDILDDLAMGLDRIEQLLTAEEETLAKITDDTQAAQAEHGGEGDQPSGSMPIQPVSTLSIERPVTPEPDKAARAAKLRDITLNTTISFIHRVSAADELTQLGSEYHSDAAMGLRLVIMDNSLDDSDRRAAIERLSRLSSESRREGMALLEQRMRRHPDHLQRVFACAELAKLDPDNLDRYVTKLREIATGSDDLFDRQSAAKWWWRVAPRDRTEILAALRQIQLEAEAVATRDITARRARELIEEIETDPNYEDDSDSP